jgi:hypothetical protein
MPEPDPPEPPWDDRAIRFVPLDTTWEAAMVQLEIFRKMPGEKKLELACSMSNSLRALVASGVRDRHPEYTEDQVRLAVNRITLGEKLFREVYPGIDIRI